MTIRDSIIATLRTAKASSQDYVGKKTYVGDVEHLLAEIARLEEERHRFKAVVRTTSLFDLLFGSDQ